MGDVEERYFPLAKHIKGLKNTGPTEGEDSEKFYDNLEYIKQKRIESRSEGTRNQRLVQRSRNH